MKAAKPYRASAPHSLRHILTQAVTQPLQTAEEPKEEFMKTVESHDLVCTENHSSKFWKSELLHNPNANIPYIVSLYWGRIGLPGQKEEKSFSSHYEAKKYLDGRLKDKKKKGYVYKDNSQIKLEVKTKTPEFQGEWDLF